MKFDLYSLKARIAPTILTAVIPIMIFNHFYVSEKFTKMVGDIFGAKIVSNLTLSTICLFFLSEFARVIGKGFFEKIYFKDETYMPTTNFMLYRNNTYSDDFKNAFRKKVKEDFNIVLPDKEEESGDEISTRKKIVETMALVRNRLHKNKFLLQHNIEYGAMRNAIGGSVIGSLLSICNIFFFKNIVLNSLAVKVSLILLIIYVLIILFSKFILGFYGKNYAKILFREYMA